MLDSGPFGGIILRSKKKSKIPRLLPRTYLAYTAASGGRLAAGLLAEQVITTYGPASGADLPPFSLSAGMECRSAGVPLRQPW